ncbi:hypothetical protein JCGZ_05298 [Jatropha curcas]|uniref:BLOC-1-related complex subunit 6 C-terminal helix domain-containing protein n=1 Tax=Jatropha curcas TaxID=180498 RepID=A0A067JCI2_JATCU|nr:uncharacterized protein LOC105650290 [Jatropha curcas]KDP20453.1 hypothetical protein JCGZ_05298 [Jatropha curcas]
MDSEEEATQPQREQSTVAEALIAQPELDPPSASPESRPDSNEPDSTDSKQALNQREIFKALKVVERDSLAIAESFTGLFASLRLALSEVTTNSTDHMQCFGDAAGRLQESVLDAATKGNRYINSCLRLNEEMKGIDSLAGQLKILRRNVDALDTAVNRLIRLP